jgi:predicted lipid carrier protein YhbT
VALVGRAGAGTTAVAFGDVAELLSDDWIAALAAAAQSASVDPDLRLVVQQRVLEVDGSATSYAVRLADGRAEVVPGDVADADITFTEDRETAAAIAAGALSAQAAFMAGRLRVGGDLRAVLERARDLSVLDAIFAPARTGTSG